jgi:hypothetical protein
VRVDEEFMGRIRIQCLPPGAKSARMFRALLANRLVTLRKVDADWSSHLARANHNLDPAGAHR